MLLSSITTTVPFRVDLAVFRESLNDLARARWIGMIELNVGISRPIAMASRVAMPVGTHEISP